MSLCLCLEHDIHKLEAIQKTANCCMVAEVRDWRDNVKDTSKIHLNSPYDLYGQCPAGSGHTTAPRRISRQEGFLGHVDDKRGPIVRTLFMSLVVDSIAAQLFPEETYILKPKNHRWKSVQWLGTGVNFTL